MQGICPHAGVAPRDVPLQELPFKKGLLSAWHNFLYVNNEHPTNMASKGYQFKHKWWHMSILSTWRQMDLNNNMTRSTSHRWFHVTSSRNHETSKKTRSHIKHQTGICATQCIEKEVHEHTAYTSHPEAIYKNLIQVDSTLGFNQDLLLLWCD